MCEKVCEKRATGTVSVTMGGVNDPVCSPLLVYDEHPRLNIDSIKMKKKICRGVEDHGVTKHRGVNKAEASKWVFPEEVHCHTLSKWTSVVVFFLLSTPKWSCESLKNSCFHRKLFFITRVRNRGKNENLGGKKTTKINLL